MGILSTALTAMGGEASAGDTSGHPSIGVINARDLTNADIMALPERERDAWIHGGVVMTVQTAAGQDGDAARCVLDWYFTSAEAHELIVGAMGEFPDRRASSTLIGMADLACETLF